MDDESDEHDYAWADGDTSYPPDGTCTFSWGPKPVLLGKSDQMSDGSDRRDMWPYCTEHDVTVSQKAAAVDSDEEDLREWISEHRTRLMKACREARATRARALNRTVQSSLSVSSVFSQGQQTPTTGTP